MEGLERFGTWFSLVAVAGAVFVAGAIGWEIGHNSGGEDQGTTSTGAVSGAIPQTHLGENLPVAAIGDAGGGEQLFTSKGCSGCHAYAGSGGDDAPPLDFMQGHLSAQEIADMSGVIWNHVPAMLPHFKEEGVRFPTFKNNEMADLAAYLHGGASGTTTTGDTPDGEQLFTSSCGSCHTLAAAGTSGNVGPNLDDLGPSENRVLSAIESGLGAMPAGLLSGPAAEAVAKYVSQNAGK